MIRTGPQTRRGYTLVELLVVMALMILLAALAAGVSYSGMIGSQKVISGADTASGWLLIAKQTALRDRAPRGVRFFLNAATAPATGFVVTEAQYIEQPDIWIPNPAQEGNPGGARIAFVYQYNAANVITSTDVYLISGNAADLTAYDSRIQAGDALILPEFGMSFKIVNPNVTFTAQLALGPALGAVGTAIPIPVTNCRKLTLVSVPDLASAGTPLQGSPPPVGTPITMMTYKFAFQSQPQVLLGQPVLQLPAGVVIDYRAGTTQAALGQPVDLNGYRTWSAPQPATAAPNPAKYNPPTTIGVTPTTDASGTYFDILFAPSGQVLKNANSLICLWVRDPEAVSHPRQLDPVGQTDCDTRSVYNDAGEQALIVVSVKSGLINTQPVNPPPPAPILNYDPYLFARDGLSSGL